jgi:hypothetical protein
MLQLIVAEEREKGTISDHIKRVYTMITELLKQRGHEPPDPLTLAALPPVSAQAHSEALQAPRNHVITITITCR